MDTQTELKLLIEPEEEQKRITTSFTKRALICCGSGVLIMLAVYCTLNAVVSAFSIPVETGMLFLVCFFSAAVVAVVTTLYREKGLLIMAFLAFLLFLLSFTEVIEGGKWVIHEISYNYSRWLPVSALFTETVDSATDPTAFLAAAGVLLSLSLGFAICLRRSVFITIAITAPIVFLTFVITNLRSDVFYLLGLISVYLTLLISGTVKPDSFTKRGLIVIPSFLIAMAFMILAYLFAPQGQYAREEQIAALGSRLRAVASQMGRFGQYWQSYGTGSWDMGWLGRLDTGLWQFNTTDVTIADAGNRAPSHQSLLEITANRAGTFYLRGYSMQSFDGRSWYNRETIPDELDFIARTMPSNIAVLYSLFIEDAHYPARMQMAISRTGDVTPGITYVPYYSADRIADDAFNPAQRTVNNISSFFYIDNSVHGYLERMRAEDFYYTDYTFLGESILFPDNSSAFPIDALRAYANVLNLMGIYTEIDSNTARELRRFAINAGIDPNADRTTIADEVARFVRSSGRYTLTPGITPEDEDFAVYFLRVLREGYCIHFATVATLMLRALDVPARFTSGYVVSVAPGEAGQTVVVTDLNAHAWVEVFYEDIGWLYLEATPPGGGLYLPPQRPHSPANDNGEQESPAAAPESNIPDYLYDERDHEGLDNGFMPDMNANNGSGTNNTQQGPEQSTFAGVLRFMINVICVVLVILAIIARRNIMHSNREKHFKQTNTNKAIIFMWRYIKRLGRQEVIIPHDIEELALKARFSQHRMTEDERAAMATYTNRVAFEISNGKSEYGKLWLKYVRALC
jgi:hypothetical protein